MWEFLKKEGVLAGPQKPAPEVASFKLTDVLLPNPKKNAKILTAVYSDEKFLSIAGCLAEKSSARIYKAIYEFIRQEKISPCPMKNIEELPDLGLKGVLEHLRVLLGGIKLMRKFNVDLNPTLEASNRLMLEGKTVIFLSIGQDVRAIFAFRAESAEGSRFGLQSPKAPACR